MYLPRTSRRAVVSPDAATVPLKPSRTTEPSPRVIAKPTSLSQPFDEAADAVVGASRAATSAPPTRAVLSGAMPRRQHDRTKCHASQTMVHVTLIPA